MGGGLIDSREFVTVKVIADSITPDGKRLITLIAFFPRPVLAEVNTHRVMSRNSASSRAVPVKKRIASVMNTPYVPYGWGQNNPGMSSQTPLEEDLQEEAQKIWLEARDYAVQAAEKLSTLGQSGVHKQWANRLLEPFLIHQALISATEWDNFFNLRCSPAAQPEMQDLALKIREAIQTSTPKLLGPGEWHIPFLDEMDASLDLDTQIKVSVARCARISFENLRDREPKLDCDLHDRLLRDGHLSPFEHVARCPTLEEHKHLDSSLTGNFQGWVQYRKLVSSS